MRNPWEVSAAQRELETAQRDISALEDAGAKLERRVDELEERITDLQAMLKRTLGVIGGLTGAVEASRGMQAEGGAQ